jgi:flagellar hook-associated protein 1 FlgK
MSSFGSLASLGNALTAQRRALEVLSQNVANVNTEGYSRQRADLVALGASPVPATWAVYDGSGSGVAVSDVIRMRDQLLEARGQTEHARSAYATQNQTTMDRVEQLLAEPTDQGLGNQLGEFWSAWSDLANRPDDDAARSQLLQRAGIVADTVRDRHDAVVGQWADQRSQLTSLTGEINTTASSIAELNQTIMQATNGGLPSGELADQRDLLVMNLVEMTGGTTRAGDRGAVDVYLGGTALVRGDTASSLSVTGATRLADQAATPVAVNWPDGRTVELSGGRIGALGESLSTTLPGIATGLDGVASTLITQVNALHAAAFDAAGNPGTAFFTGTTADTIAVGIINPSLVAASSSAGGNRDGSAAAAIAALRSSQTGPDEVYRDLVVEIGTASQTTTRRADMQTAVMTAIDAARESASGVNLDEEMTNMIATQRAYEGAARVMTTIDSTLDTLINRTGLVGR